MGCDSYTGCRIRGSGTQRSEKQDIKVQDQYKMSELVLSRLKTASSRVLAQSQLLEEHAQRFQYSWQLIDSAEQLKGLSVSQTSLLEIPKPKIPQQPLVQSSDNLIHSGSIFRVNPMEFYYYRISLRNQKPPLNCQVLCEGDFQIMISFTNPTPTKFNCEHVIRNRNWIIKFSQEELLYLSFIARKSTEVRYILHFGSPDQRRPVRPEPAPHQYTRFENIPRTPQNIVNQNIVRQTQQVNRFQAEILRSRRNIHVMRVATQQRQHTAQGQRDRKIDLQIKELSHEESLVKRLMLQKQHHRRVFEQFWIAAIRTTLQLHDLHQVFEHKKFILSKNRMISFKFKIKCKRIAKYMERTRGDTIEERTAFDVQCCLSMFAKHVLKQLVNRHMRMALPVLSERAKIFQIKVCIGKTHRKILLIRKYFLHFLLRVRKYKQDMLVRWENFIQKHYQIQLKIRIQDRDKRQMAWFVQLQDKTFSQMIQKRFLQDVLKDRIKLHFYEQRLIKQMRNEIKSSRAQLKILTDPFELAITNQHIRKLTHDVFALQMKNQFFILADVLKYMLILMDKHLVVQEEQQPQSATPNPKTQPKPNKKIGRLSIFQSK